MLEIDCHSPVGSADGAPRRESVQSLERALDLLEALASGRELGVTELAGAAGLPPSTVIACSPR